jgi:hypothetical protein
LDPGSDDLVAVGRSFRSAAGPDGTTGSPGLSATAYVTGSIEEATVATHDKAMAAARAAFEAAEQHGVKPDDCVSLATQVLPTVG